MNRDDDEATGYVTTLPLHVRVAEALGWTELEPDANEAGHWGGTSPPGGNHMLPIQFSGIVPRYDIDWEATGPLIERLKMRVGPVRFDGPTWEAVAHGSWVNALTPLVAVCLLILDLQAARKLAGLLAQEGNAVAVSPVKEKP